ncbi:MAG: class I SAM-dependent methyltransferase [Deltaproteobacteria bacterium]|nr:class I SAM-dependent methyltransferase [Deltaproteobacteria bacterium]
MDYRDHQRGVPADYFWFRAKRDLIASLFRRHTPARDLSILNVGAGVGEDLEVIRRHGRVQILDASPEAVALVPEALVEAKQVGDVCALPFADATFDVVTAFDLLEHVEDDHVALAEIRRVLRPGGALLLTVPAHAFLYGAHDRALGHHRRYSRATLQRLLSGLELERLGYWTCTLFLPLAAHRWLDRGRDRSSLSYFELDPRLDRLFYRLMALEMTLLRWGAPLPMGTSLFAVARRTA